MSERRAPARPGCSALASCPGKRSRERIHRSLRKSFQQRPPSQGAGRNRHSGGQVGRGSRATRTPLTGYFQFPMELSCKSGESVTVCCLPGRGESYCGKLEKAELSCPKQNSNQGSWCLEGGFRALSYMAGCLNLLSLPVWVTLGKYLPPLGLSFSIQKRRHWINDAGGPLELWDAKVL